MDKPIVLKDEDVVCMSVAKSFAETPTSKVGELMDIVNDWLIASPSIAPTGQWVKEGVECQVLLAEGGCWQKGRVRFRIEFIPHEPAPVVETPNEIEVSLSDLRSSLNVEQL